MVGYPTPHQYCIWDPRYLVLNLAGMRKASLLCVDLLGAVTGFLLIRIDPPTDIKYQSKTNQPHQQPSFGDYFYAMTMSRNHSKIRDNYKQYLPDEDEFDLHERAKRQRILIGYASAIATCFSFSFTGWCLFEGYRSECFLHG